MTTTNIFLGRVQEICQNIAHTNSLEELYEQLLRFVSKVCDSPASALMTVAEYGVLNQTFWVRQGTGRFADQAGEPLRDEQAVKILREAISQRASHHEKNSVALLFPHPENFAILLYLELQREINEEYIRQFAFLIGSVSSSIQIHTAARLAERTNRAAVVALASLAEHKDQYTGEHVMRVAIMTDEIVQVLVQQGAYKEHITPEFERLISTASILHDVGKVAIPDNILQKPGMLNAAERKAVETHTTIGQKVLEKASRMLDGNNYLLKLSGEVALYHHEHYDGRGYPARLAGQQIPLAARIVGLTDVFDALTSARPYKKAWPEDEATAYVAGLSGSQFDPLVVEAFLRVMQYRKEAALIQWTEDMSVQAPHLENYLRFFIELINQLSSAEKIGNRRIVESVLDELINYTQDHFRHEEQIMQETGFPSLDRHKRLHASFTETIQNVRWQYLNGFRTQINNEVLLFLRNWLNKHILVEDMKYAPLACAQTAADA